MRDFTFKTYNRLLLAILDSGYSIQTMEEFMLNPNSKVVVLRHDCDLWPENDLVFAKMEKDLNIQATYYFRVPYTFKIKIINQIAKLGHEIGYHYENLAEFKGNFDKSIIDFKDNLKKLREIYPVKTISMHGRPLSKWDNRQLWDRFDFRDFHVIGEPYLSVDYNKVLYLTDTGNMWNGDKVSVRDTVTSNYNFDLSSTFDLINALKRNELPDQIIINTHADRWNDNFIIWFYKELLQKLKNLVKWQLKKIRKLK